MLVTLKRAAFAVGVAATVVAVGASQATAATTFTVKIGAATAGTGTFTSATTGTSPQIALKDVTSGTTLNCVSGTASGTVTKLGKGLAGTGLAKVTASTWKTCTGPLNLTFTVTQSGSWSINGVSYASGVTSGTITAISAKVSGTGCSFTVTGATNAKFTNSTQILAVAPVTGSTSVLKISAVSGCFGLVNNGDTSTFTGAYKVAAKTGAGTAGALSITAP